MAVKFGQDVYAISVSPDTMSFGYKACGDRLLRVHSKLSDEFQYKVRDIRKIARTKSKCKPVHVFQLNSKSVWPNIDR